MGCCRKLLTALLACLIALQPLTLPVFATEDPELLKAAAEETVVLEASENEQESLPEEETEPTEETVAEEEDFEEIPSEDNFTEAESAIPLYFQTDYPDVYYGDGTVATSGCSITALAMVATYLTGHEYLPDELARYFADDGNNHMERLEYGSRMLQLPFEKNWDWHVTYRALQEGKIAIVLVNDKSPFTQSQHFILLTGLTEDGRILVHDPYAPNYDHWALQQGFAEGFTESDIVWGFEGAWVYDCSAMPEEPFVYFEEIREPDDYGSVPLYFQSDYPNVRYAGGTVATSGCSITSLAMVASYMTGHVYLPDDLARYFGGRAESHMERLEYGSQVLQIPYEKNWDWHVTCQALRDGKIAIVLVNDNTYFTQSQHFIILTGMTPDGKIMVNDSSRSNYSHWALQEGFVSGFEPEQILCGFEGAWVYDKSAMPEEPVEFYCEPLPERGESRYTGVQLTLEEEDLLAKLIWAEARGEPAEGQQAVAEVVLNRLVSGKFSDTLSDVIYGAEQFRGVPYMEDAELSQAQYEAVEAALYGPNILPMDVYYFATEETNDNVWGQIGGHIFCGSE